MRIAVGSVWHRRGDYPPRTSYVVKARTSSRVTLQAQYGVFAAGALELFSRRQFEREFEPTGAPPLKGGER